MGRTGRPDRYGPSGTRDRRKMDFTGALQTIAGDLSGIAGTGSARAMRAPWDDRPRTHRRSARRTGIHAARFRPDVSSVMDLSLLRSYNDGVPVGVSGHPTR